VPVRRFLSNCCRTVSFTLGDGLYNTPKRRVEPASGKHPHSESRLSKRLGAAAGPAVLGGNYGLVPLKWRGQVWRPTLDRLGEAKDQIAVSVDAGFLDAAQAYGPPERRFRFSSSCTEGRCARWDGRGCGLIDRIHEYVERAGALEIPRTLLACAIRAGCRWWRQRGAAACAVRPLVTTDAGSTVADTAPAQ
jgi:hypothetical protein